MKLELGGGTKARGDGWINMDQCESADIRHDLNVVPWPIDSGTVAEIYSSHCIEHLHGPFSAFNEICRICIPGAQVEIRVPHPASHLAMTYDHKHVFSPIQAINMERFFPTEFWKLPQRMRLENILYCPTILIEECKNELPFLAGLSDEAIMKWIPGTCHECRFFYKVIENEYYPR